MKSAPTKFEVMRRNRLRRPRLEAVIDGIETEVDREWAALRAREQAEFEDSDAWLDAMRRRAAAEVQPRRRWWQFWGRRSAVST